MRKVSVGEKLTWASEVRRLRERIMREKLAWTSSRGTSSAIVLD